MMKRSILFVLIFCVAVPFSEAQLWKMKKWEVMAGLGPSVFFGDIGGFSQTKNILGFKDISFLQTRFNIGGTIKYRITRDINARISMTYGMLHATDSRGSNIKRGYDARTSIFEPALIGEYSFIKNKTEGSYLFLKGKSRSVSGFFTSLDFYAFTGIGGVNYKVKGNDPLIQRGMRSGGFSAVIPAGLGSTFIYSPNLNFGVEIGGRYSFTDYLDGFSPQQSKANDVYYFLNFAVTYKLKTGPNGLPSFR
jgi:hypothetical protein